MGKTYKDSKYRPENQNKVKVPGLKVEKRITVKKERGATKKQLQNYK